MNLLLFSTGRRVSLIRLLKKAAHNMGVDLRIYGMELNPMTSSLFECDHVILAPRISHPDYSGFVQSVIDQYQIDCVLPGNDLDLEFLAKNTLFRTKTLSAKPESLEIFSRKSKTANFFQEIGLMIPRIYETVPDCFPAVCKEDRGFGSRNQFYLEEEADFKKAITKVKEPFLQKWIQGREYTIDVFCDSDCNPVNRVCRVREAVRCGVSDIGRVDMNPELLALLDPLLSQFGICGPWNLQCIDDGYYFWFLEVNARFSGGIPLTIASGADFCQNLLEWGMGKTITPFKTIENGLMMFKHESEIFVHESKIPKRA